MQTFENLFLQNRILGYLLPNCPWVCVPHHEPIKFVQVVVPLAFLAEILADIV